MEQTNSPEYLRNVKSITVIKYHLGLLQLTLDRSP
jgi:hypothetical protein